MKRCINNFKDVNLIGTKYLDVRNKFHTYLFATCKVQRLKRTWFIIKQKQKTIKKNRNGNELVKDTISLFEHVPFKRDRYFFLQKYGRCSKAITFNRYKWTTSILFTTLFKNKILFWKRNFNFKYTVGLPLFVDQVQNVHQSFLVAIKYSRRTFRPTIMHINNYNSINYTFFDVLYIKVVI